MIKVERTVPPKHLTRNAPKWTNDLLVAIEKYEHGGREPAQSLWNKYNKPYVKSALGTMFHGKCAYCESKIAHIDYPHIEHYRPKKKFPKFTFEWQNLLLACTKCNGKEFKGDSFPFEDDDENKPFLLNPCEDDPTQHLLFEQARIVPLSERGQQTRDILGLNRDDLWDRRRERFRFIHSLRLCIETCERNGDQDKAHYCQTVLNEATSAATEYTAMVRQFMANPLPEKSPL